MKKSEVLKLIADEIEGPGATEQAKEILKSLEKIGMLPVTKRVGFSGTAIVYKFEEDIEGRDWDRAFDNLRD